jgi:hypothetical protein
VPFCTSRSQALEHDSGEKQNEPREGDTPLASAPLCRRPTNRHAGHLPRPPAPETRRR